MKNNTLREDIASILKMFENDMHSQHNIPHGEEGYLTITMALDKLELLLQRETIRQLSLEKHSTTGAKIVIEKSAIKYLFDHEAKCEEARQEGYEVGYAQAETKQGLPQSMIDFIKKEAQEATKKIDNLITELNNN